MFAFVNSKYMKANLTTSRIINIVITVVILLFISFFALLFWTKRGFVSDTDSSRASYKLNSLPPLDPVISYSLPHNKYLQLTDSIKFSREFKNGRNAGGLSVLGPLGFTTLQRCDTCGFTSFWSGKGVKKEYFIRFGDWKLDTARGEDYSPIIYFVKNGQSYLRKRFCKKNKYVKSRKSMFTAFTCEEKDVSVPFRVDSQSKSIMIQINKSTFDISMPILVGSYVLFFIYFVYFVIGSFIKFLAEIAQGTPFSERNVKRLKFITLNLLIIPLGLFLINVLIMPLLFHSYFTSDIHLDSESWKSLVKPAILCLIFAALYRAFKKGKALKEENDLTV